MDYYIASSAFRSKLLCWLHNVAPYWLLVKITKKYDILL